jgi:hypothetical protein
MGKYKINPFSGDLDRVGNSAGAYVDGEVEYHYNLPVTVGTPAVDSAYLVRKASGIPFVSRKPAGIWVRELNNGDLDDWVYAGVFSDLLRDSNFRIINNADITKELAFDASGIATGTTRTVSAPDNSGMLMLSGAGLTPATLNQVAVEVVSNTRLILKLRGSDNVVRSLAFTLS